MQRTLPCVENFLDVLGPDERLKPVADQQGSESTLRIDGQKKVVVVTPLVDLTTDPARVKQPEGVNRERQLGRRVYAGNHRELALGKPPAEMFQCLAESAPLALGKNLIQIREPRLQAGSHTKNPLNLGEHEAAVWTLFQNFLCWRTAEWAPHG